METAEVAGTSRRRQRTRVGRRSRLRRSLRALQWPLAVAVAGSALVLGFVGHRLAAPDGDAGLWLYRALQLFALEGGDVAEAPWALQIARLLAPAVAAYAIWQALSAIFSQQLTRVRVRLLSDHVVVCGLGDKGQLLTRSLLASGYRVVAIDIRADADASGLLRDEGLVLVTGDARDTAILRRAGVDRAHYLISVCTDDGANAEVAGHLAALRQGSAREPLTAFVHMVSPELTQLLRASVATDDSLRLEFFDIYESGARTLLQTFPPFAAPAGQNGPPHLLLVGFGELARSALRMASLRAALEDNGSRRPVVTIVAQNADGLVERFAEQCGPAVRSFNLAPHNLTHPGPPSLPELQAATAEGPAVTTAYVCLDDDANGLTAGLTVSPLLAATGGPVVVALWEAAELGALIAGSAVAGLQAIQPFPVLQRTCTADLVLGGLHEVLARAFHREYVEHNAGSSDEAAVPWDELPPALQESNRRAADSIRQALGTIGCRVVPLTDGDDRAVIQPAEVEVLARMEHERWRAERTQQGWTLGERDVERRRSPLLVPWEDLPEEAKDYNRRWAGSLPEHLHANGLQIAKIR